MALTHIDCFSGPGGICTGFHAAGIDTKLYIIHNKQSSNILAESILVS